MLGKLRIIDFSYNPLLELIDVELIKEYAQKYNYNIVSFRDNSIVGALGKDTLENKIAIIYKDDKEKLQDHLSYKKIKNITVGGNSGHKATIEVIPVNKEEKIARKLIHGIPLDLVSKALFGKPAEVAILSVKDETVSIETEFTKFTITSMDARTLIIMSDFKLLFTGDHEEINRLVLDSIFNGTIKYKAWSGL